MDLFYAFCGMKRFELEFFALQRIFASTRLVFDEPSNSGAVLAGSGCTAPGIGCQIAL